MCSGKQSGWPKFFEIKLTPLWSASLTKAANMSSKIFQNRKHPLMKSFAETILPFAWRKLESELKIIKTTYNFAFNELD